MAKKRAFKLIQSKINMLKNTYEHEYKDLIQKCLSLEEELIQKDLKIFTLEQKLKRQEVTLSHLNNYIESSGIKMF